MFKLQFTVVIQQDQQPQLHFGHSGSGVVDTGVGAGVVVGQGTREHPQRLHSSSRQGQTGQTVGGGGQPVIQHPGQPRLHPGHWVVPGVVVDGLGVVDGHVLPARHCTPSLTASRCCARQKEKVPCSALFVHFCFCGLTLASRGSQSMSQFVFVIFVFSKQSQSLPALLHS